MELWQKWEREGDQEREGKGWGTGSIREEEGREGEKRREKEGEREGGRISNQSHSHTEYFQDVGYQR